MDVFDGTGGGNLTAGSYGRLVERGGYATGGLVGEHGPEIAWAPAGTCVLPAAGLVSRLDTSATRWLDVTGHVQPSWSESVLASEGGSGSVTYGLRLPTARDPDDGSAGVPAKI